MEIGHCFRNSNKKSFRFKEARENKADLIKKNGKNELDR